MKQSVKRLKDLKAIQKWYKDYRTKPPTERSISKTHLAISRQCIDKRGANPAAPKTRKEETGQKRERRQINGLNHRVEPAHRAIMRIVRPRFGVNAFRSARATLQGIALTHMRKKSQRLAAHSQLLSAAGQFSPLAA